MTRESKPGSGPKNELRHPELTNPQLGRSLPFLQKNVKVIVLKLVTASGASERAFRLHKDRITIGKVASADVKIAGEGISPIHAVIERVRGAEGGRELVSIYDLASETGVFVNGDKTVTRQLEPGDEVTLGSCRFKFYLEAIEPSAIRDQVRGRPVGPLVKPTAEPFQPRGKESSPVAEAGFDQELSAEGQSSAEQDELFPLLLQDEHEIEDIFDHRPSFQTALEVVMSWEGTILDVKHFVQQKSVTLGSVRGSDFGIPEVVVPKRFHFVTRQGSDFTLNVDPKMSGLMQRDGALISVEDLRRTRGSAGAPFQLLLKKDDFAKISLGGVDFYLSFGAAPPKLKRSKWIERDPLYFKIMTGSTLMTVALITALMNVRVPQNTEPEKAPDRLATVLYAPEKYVSHYPQPVQPAAPVVPTPPEPKKPEPQTVTKIVITPKPVDKTKPIPKEMTVAQGKQTTSKSTRPTKTQGQTRAQNEAREGEGARARGKEGTRGSKNASSHTEHQTLAKRPSPQGGLGRGAGNSQVQSEGNVDILKGASSRLQNLLGNSALKLGTGGEKLQGFGGFNTQGEGGLALSGDGRGGGGNAASLGGLGNKGTGGGRIGTGKGAAGSGSGIIGGRARVALRTGGAEETVVMGAIDADAVRAAIEAHRDEFAFCYENELKGGDKGISGRVSTSFVIGSSGRANQAGIESSSLNNSNVERCVLKVIKQIEFPMPRGGGIVQVTYPFKFSPLNK